MKIDKINQIIQESKLDGKDVSKVSDGYHTFEELYGELADMKIMMAQAEILFDKQKIDKMVEFKLNRFKEKYL